MCIEVECEGGAELLSWEEAKERLAGISFDNDYVGPFYAWTKSKVIVVAMYDGSEWLVGIPRNPSANEIPVKLGGG